MIESTIFLAELASGQLEPPRSGKQLEDRDSLEWFTNTKLYRTWLIPPRGEVTRSRFIWFTGIENPEFGTLFSAARRQESVRVLYFNCGLDIGNISNFPSIALRYPNIGSSETALILWSLFGQALQGDYPSTDHMGASISQITSMYPRMFLDIQADREKVLNAFEKLIQAALNLEPRKETVIVLDHIDILDRMNLKPLIECIQRVLDCQRSGEIAQIRCLICGQPTPDVKIALQGITSIDNNTEYYGKLLKFHVSAQLTLNTEFLQMLKFDSMDRRRDRIVAPEVSTTHWIWSNPSYLEWYRASSGILWIQGKPGSGKSVLAKSIQTRLLELADSSSVSISGRPIVGGWYYSQREMLRAHSMMLRSLLLQVLEQDRSLYSHAQQFLHNEVLSRGGYHAYLSDIIQKVLISIGFSNRNNRQICCVVDGLDESHFRDRDLESREEMLLFFKRLVKPPSIFKLICLSRPNDDIKKSLRHYPSIVLQQLNLSDIEKIVDAGLKVVVQALSDDDSSMSEDSDSKEGSDEEDDSLCAFQKRPVAILAARRRPPKPTMDLNHLVGYFRKVKIEENYRLENIRKYLIKHASGVILWVTTILKALETRATEPLCDLEQIEKELYRLPVDLEKLYREIVKGLVSTLAKNTLDTSRRALIWVSVATAVRPFQLQELLDALSPNRKLKVHSWNSFRRQLQRLCGPFIEVIRSADSPYGDLSTSDLRKDDEVQLLHQTVKDFLEDREAAGSLYVSTSQAQCVVETESMRYFETALPDPPSDNSPLPVQAGSDWKENVRKIAAYFEERPLLPFILDVYKELLGQVPKIYRFMFENTTNPSLMEMTEQQKTDLGNLEHDFASLNAPMGQSAIVEEYFRTACLNGWVTAIDNIFLLSSLRFSKDRMREWYYDEPAIIHGTLMAAIGCNMLKEVKRLAFWVYLRGFALLHRRGQELRETTLTHKALQSQNEELALVVFGYEDEEERLSLLEYIRNQHKAMPPKVSSGKSDELLEIRKSIHAVLEFWGRHSGKYYGLGAQVDNERANNTVPEAVVFDKEAAERWPLSLTHLCEEVENGSLDDLYIYKPQIQPL